MVPSLSSRENAVDADWSTIEKDAVAAAAKSLGESWASAAHGATGSIAALLQTAQYIKAHEDGMTKDEATFVVAQQKAAMSNVLTAYKSIGAAAAQDAVAAVVQVVVKALPALIGFA